MTSEIKRIIISSQLYSKARSDLILRCNTTETAAQFIKQFKDELATALNQYFLGLLPEEKDLTWIHNGITLDYEDRAKRMIHNLCLKTIKEKL